MRKMVTNLNIINIFVVLILAVLGCSPPASVEGESKNNSSSLGLETLTPSFIFSNYSATLVTENPQNLIGTYGNNCTLNSDATANRQWILNSNKAPADGSYSSAVQLYLTLGDENCSLNVTAVYLPGAVINGVTQGGWFAVNGTDLIINSTINNYGTVVTKFSYSNVLSGTNITATRDLYMKGAYTQRTLESATINVMFSDVNSFSEQSFNSSYATLNPTGSLNWVKNPDYSLALLNTGAKYQIDINGYLQARPNIDTSLKLNVGTTGANYYTIVDANQITGAYAGVSYTINPTTLLSSYSDLYGFFMDKVVSANKVSSPGVGYFVSTTASSGFPINTIVTKLVGGSNIDTNALLSPVNYSSNASNKAGLFSANGLFGFATPWDLTNGATANTFSYYVILVNTDVAPPATPTLPAFEVIKVSLTK